MHVTNGITTFLPPPEGYAVDFDNPQRQAVPEAYWAAGIGSALALLMMAQRLYTRKHLEGRFELDDWIFVFACLTSTATVVLCTLMFVNGAGGVHVWEISIEKYQTFMTLVYAAAPIYLLSGSSAKISLLLFYRRLFPLKWLRLSVWILLGIIVSYTAAIFFSLIFACMPMARSWDPKITDGACINGSSLFISTAVANIISDVLLLALPIQPLVNLQMPIRQKIGLVLIFTVGLLTVVTSVVRLVLLLDMLRSLDQSWAISYPSLWIIVEANLLIICASFSTLKKFVGKVVPSILGGSTFERGTTEAPTSLVNLEHSPSGRIALDKKWIDNSSQIAIVRRDVHD